MVRTAADILRNQQNQSEVDWPRITRQGLAVLACGGGLLLPACANNIADHCANSTGLEPKVYSYLPDSTGAPSELYTDLMCEIQQAQEGDTIRIATAKIRSEGIIEALIDARDRGVSVRMVADESVKDDDRTQVLIDALGSDTTEDSFVIFRSGLGKGIQHAKLFIVENENGNGKVVGGSSNLSPDSLGPDDPSDGYQVSYNVDLVTDKPEIRTAAEEYVEDLIQRPTDLPDTSDATSADGEISISFLPVETIADSPITKFLDQVECKPVVDESDKPTTVDVVMYDAAAGARHNIQQLAELAGNGCEVRVVINGKADEYFGERARVAAYLRKAGAHVVHVVEDFPEFDFFVHGKLIVVNGGGGKQPKAAQIGSQNLTGGSATRNLEGVVTTFVPKDVDDVTASFEEVWAALQKAAQTAPSR